MVRLQNTNIYVGKLYKLRKNVLTVRLKLFELKTSLFLVILAAESKKVVEFYKENNCLLLKQKH